MATYDYVGNGTPDGSVFGASGTEKISFYGRTPIVIATKPTALGTVVFSAAATGMWAFSSSTVARAAMSRIDSLGTKLYNLGLLS